MIKYGVFTLAVLLASCAKNPPIAALKAPAPSNVRVLAEPAQGHALLAAEGARAKAAGAEAIELVGTSIVSDGERMGAFVEIAAERCLVGFARGSGAIIDVDLAAYSDEGDAIATDDAPDAAAEIVVCPPHPRRVYVAARVAQGNGLLAVGVLSATPAVTEALRAAQESRDPGKTLSNMPPFGDLASTVHQHRRALGSRWEELRRVALVVDPHAWSRMSVDVDAGRCLDVLAVAGDDLGSLELVAEDVGGRVLGRGHEEGRDRALVLCAARRASISLAIRPHAASGVVAVSIARSQLGAAPELSRSEWLLDVASERSVDDERASLERALADAPYFPPRVIARDQAKIGERVSVAVELARGCSRIDVVAGAPMSAIEAVIWDGSGKRLAEARGAARVALLPCGEGGPARVDVEPLASPGPFAVVLRADRAAPLALVAHRVAAARLLARLDVEGMPSSAGDVASADAIHLDEGLRVDVPIGVAARTCLTAFAALDDKGHGLDLRLVDRASGESTLNRADHVVSARICATDAPIAGVMELRLASGSTDALWVLRTSPDR